MTNFAKSGNPIPLLLAKVLPTLERILFWNEIRDHG